MRPIGLYLHIPFCDGKCAYCNFYSTCADESAMKNYTDNLMSSVRTWSRRLDREVDTVYFGGGTPSLLGHKRLIEILSTVKENFRVTEDAEITVEVNPTSTDTLDFHALRDAGFNRLSIGLQSAVDAELRMLGRRHTAQDAAVTVYHAKTAGFENISLDVMLAVPGQTITSLNKTLDFCAERQVQHISAYILKVEEGTPFYLDRAKLSLYDDDAQAEFYEHTVSRLRELGYRQYEISNFALEGYESRHNLHYWHDEEYLGLGPSAHSLIDEKRFYYKNSFDEFYAGKTMFESLGGYPEEYIMLALRLTEGLRYQKYAERYQEPLSEKFMTAAAELADKGYLNVDENAISLTVRGFLVSNAVIAYLIQNT